MIYIGTSGFSYPHWKGVFYPKDLSERDWLSFYSQKFNTLEINTSFYHQVTRSTYLSWKKTVSSNFIFSIKGSRYITHIKKLKDSREPISSFFESARYLGEGNIALWQFPPNWKFNEARLKDFVRLLPKDWRHAFEFRNSTWINQKTFSLLRENKMAIVFQDNEEWPKTEEKTTNFIYIRLHGRKLYTSSYSEEELMILAEKIENWHKENKDVYCYFNNDSMGYAVLNALRLKEILASATL